NFATSSEAPNKVSSDFGKLEVRRHFTSGIDCATAGMATADDATPRPAALRNSRRFMDVPLFMLGAWPLVMRPASSDGLLPGIAAVQDEAGDKLALNRKVQGMAGVTPR